MHISKTNILLFSGFLCLMFMGIGCINASDDTFPPKPPIPGFQRSPAIDRLAP